MVNRIKVGIGVLLVAALLIGAVMVPAMSAKKDKSGDGGTLALQHTEAVNKHLGPKPEVYTEPFPVKSGANEIDVQLKVTNFDPSDYGKIHLRLYNPNGNEVASDTLYLFENYLDINYQRSLTPGDWKIIVSSADDLGSNTINVAGSINVLE